MDDFFGAFGFVPVTSTGYDEAIRHSGVTIAYLWGENCFNCEQFKKAVAVKPEALAALDVRWVHANVYDDEALGRRMGLHGVPTFMVYVDGLRQGRVTGWPGIDAFSSMVVEMKKRIKNP